MWVVPCAITKGPPDEGGPGVSQEKRLHRGCGLWLPLGAPKLLELRRRKLGVSDSVLDRAMPKPILYRASIVACGQGVAAAMA